MNAAFIIYTLLLLIEGGLAWTAGGEAFLPVALSAALTLYYAMSGGSRPMAEATRLISAGVLVLAAPFYYQNKMVPMLLCFIAMPHYLAATQALWEKHWGSAGTARENPKTRAIVFTVAFYTSMGLVFLLARGVEPDISRLTTSLLALVVLVLGLAAWDLSRILRLKPGQPGPAPHRARNLLTAAVLLAIVAALFSGPLPWAAGQLSRISPNWRLDPIDFKNKPPKPPAPQDGDSAPPPPDEVRAPAPEESAQTGRHQLPKRANLQGTSDVIGFIKLGDPAQASSLTEKGPLYIRSHTLNLFQDGRWQADVIDGVWVEDKDDGNEDGMVTFRTPDRPVPHEVFLLNANGYTLPGIQGMTAIALPRVFAMPGDVLQTSAVGDFRYRAVSAPLIFDRLPNSVPLTAGTPQSSVHTMMPKGDIGVRLHEMSSTLFSKVPELSDRIATLRRLFAEKYQYSGVMTNPNELDPLENFLFDERRGYCDFFATAGALLLRDAGVSTRMAYGFATEEYDSAEGLFTFRNRNAHTWTEVYIDKIGWTVCDFTPSDNIGKVPGSSAEPPPPPQFDPAKFDDASKHEPPPPPPPAAAKSEVDSDFLAQLMDSILKQPWVEVLRQYGPIALLSAVGLFLIIRFFRRSKEDAAAAAAAKELAAREKQPAYFMEFLRVTAAAGHPKPDGATPMEHFTALAGAGLPVPPLSPMIHYHYAQRYENVPPDDEREKSFFEDIKVFAEATVPREEN